ncbi:hypothetical protein [Spiroplasma endosymbiont of Aleiodes alternator]|uniref:hypothetical protein n=1 Tax=Spiroplasma endosymbiont of Aleiodes alternator TaxID=3139329 RepID=UPI003CCB2B0B
MNKLTRIEICVKIKDEIECLDYRWWTKEFNEWKSIKNIKYDIQDNGNTLKVWIDE